MKRERLLILSSVVVVVIAFSGIVGAQTNKITVWCWDPGFNIVAMETAREIYRDINPDAEIVIEEVAWEDLQTRLNVSFAAGQTSTLPDIILMQDNALQKFVYNYPDAFYDLSNSGIDFSRFAEFKVKISTINGKHYAVPFDNGAAINALRVDILEEAGYTIEDFEDITYSEYIRMGKDILEKTGKALNSALAGEPDLLMLMMQSVGTWMFDENGEVNIANNEKIKEIVKVYIELLESGVLVHVNEWDQYISSIQSGTVAGTINGCWIIGSITQQENQRGKWRITNIPRLDNVEGASNYSNQGGSSWMVLASSANPELAADFLKHTFAGSVELYERILPSTGAIATYLPAKDSDVYNQPHDFFGGQVVFAKIAEYADQVPEVNYGVYNYEARDAIATAISKIIRGAAIDSALQEAENTVKFIMNY